MLDVEEAALPLAQASCTSPCTTTSLSSSPATWGGVSTGTPPPPPRRQSWSSQAEGDEEDGTGGVHPPAISSDPGPSVRFCGKSNNKLSHALLRTASSARLDDALERAGHAAREELREFAESTPPRRADSCAACTLALVLFFRWPIALALRATRRCRPGTSVSGRCCGGGFLTSLVRLGGVEKVNTLLTVAQLGEGAQGVDEAEFERQGERLVSNATAGCQNTAVVATLFIATTHLGCGAPLAPHCARCPAPCPCVALHRNSPPLHLSSRPSLAGTLAVRRPGWLPSGRSRHMARHCAMRCYGRRSHSTL